MSYLLKLENKKVVCCRWQEKPPFMSGMSQAMKRRMGYNLDQQENHSFEIENLPKYLWFKLLENKLRLIIDNDTFDKIKGKQPV